MYFSLGCISFDYVFRGVNQDPRKPQVWARTPRCSVAKLPTRSRRISRSRAGVDAPVSSCLRVFADDAVVFIVSGRRVWFRGRTAGLPLCPQGPPGPVEPPSDLPQISPYGEILSYEERVKKYAALITTQLSLKHDIHIREKARLLDYYIFFPACIWVFFNSNQIKSLSQV